MVSDQYISDAERRLQDLVTHPRESLDTELKGWLDLSWGEHKADLAQAMLALANHGGGYILVGFEESGGTWVAAEPRPADLSQYTQDNVNGVVQSYAEPTFHCEVHHIAHPMTGRAFPVVVVPGGHRLPIRAKRDGPNRKHVLENSYYIRRPGPKSECPQTGQEWDQLIHRCLLAAREDLVDSIRGVLLGPNVHGAGPSVEEERRPRLDNWIEASEARWQSVLKQRLPSEDPWRFKHGTWSVAYAVQGNVKPLSLSAFKELLAQVQGHETGWPPWWVPTKQDITPYAFDETIECWLGDSPSAGPDHSDFWRASPDGLMYLVRGYYEVFDFLQVPMETVRAELQRMKGRER